MGFTLLRLGWFWSLRSHLAEARQKVYNEVEFYETRPMSKTSLPRVLALVSPTYSAPIDTIDSIFESELKDHVEVESFDCSSI